MLWALDTVHGHHSPFRCEGVTFPSPKAVSVALKEDYSIPERCLGMRDMLKKFKGKMAAFVPAPGTPGSWFTPFSHPYPGAWGVFVNKLCPTGLLFYYW